MGSRAWDPENDVENDTDNEAENDVENETEKKDAFCKIPITPGWHEPQSRACGKGSPGPAQQSRELAGLVALILVWQNFLNVAFSRLYYYY